MPKRIKLMIVEDHLIFRQCFVNALKEVTDFNIIGEASNGMEILKLIRKNKPDIVISDIEMPEMNGYELAKQINKEFPTVKIIFLSMYYSSFYAAQAIKNGINACLPKQCSFTVLEQAVKTVHTENYYFNKEIGNTLISEMMAENHFELIRDQLALNHREVEVLKLICEGKINREIAKSLKLTPATIDFHRQSIYKKTEISSVALLVKYAIKNGITTIN